MATPIRCPWALKSPLLLDYHDHEWGVPLHDSRKLFELLILEGAQAGLSWEIILAKRKSYRQAFDRFDPAKMARYDAAKIRSLLANPGIVRNRLKIEAAIGNAKVYLALRAEGIELSEFLWRFVGDRPIANARRKRADVPASTAISDAMSRALKRRGFRFVGSTTVYAFMQAAGMVNDHVVDCFRYREIAAGAQE